MNIKPFITKKMVGVFMIIIGAIIVIGFIANLSKPSSSAPNQNSTTQPVSTSVNIGDNAVLDEGADQNSVLVATTQANLDEIVKLAVVKDTVGMTEMVLNGQAFFVDRNTKVLVIDGGFTSLRVRIMSGDYYGASGWVPMEFCKKP